MSVGKPALPAFSTSALSLRPIAVSCLLNAPGVVNMLAVRLPSVYRTEDFRALLREDVRLLEMISCVKIYSPPPLILFLEIFKHMHNCLHMHLTLLLTCICV